MESPSLKLAASRCIMQLEPYGASAHCQAATSLKNRWESGDYNNAFRARCSFIYLAEGQGNKTKKFVISINAWIKVPHRRESFIELSKNL